MPRIPYVPEDISEPANVVDAIRKRRGGRLINLDRQLLHSPIMAGGWNVYMGAIRTNLIVAPQLREIAMCVVAILNGAEYEFHHHAPELLKEGGTPAQVAALRDPDSALNSKGIFDEQGIACIALTIEMTRNIKVSDATFTAMRRHLSDQTMVELVMVIAAYNMVSRFLVALDIQPET